MSILPTGFHAPNAPNFYLADETIPIPAGKKITLGTDGLGNDGTIQFNKDVDGLLFATLGKQDITANGNLQGEVISLTNDLTNFEGFCVARLFVAGGQTLGQEDAAIIEGDQTNGITCSAALTVPTLTVNGLLNGVPPGSVARATFTGALSVPSAAIGTGTYVIWDTVDFDFVGTTTAPFEDFVIPSNGYYRLYASAQFAANTTGVRQVAFRNTTTNTTLDLFQGAPPGGGSSASVGLEGTYLFQENDTVQIWVGQNSGSPLNCTAARFEIQFVRAA
jgi:hypothetical protein